MKTIAKTTYVIGDAGRIETSETPPVRTGPAGWGHRQRPGLRFLAQDGFLVPIRFQDDAFLRVADERLLADLARIDEEIEQAALAVSALRDKRQQLLRDSVERCALVPVALDGPSQCTCVDCEERPL